jgi:hypothetical protein
LIWYRVLKTGILKNGFTGFNREKFCQRCVGYGMLVSDVMMLADDCTPYKCCIISLALATIADLLE